MEIIVRERGASWAAPTSFPGVYLTRDQWDDFTFKTTFQVDVVPAFETERISVGDVKIIQSDQTEGRTELPGRRFARLPGRYCSLGQEFSYYEALDRLGSAVRDEILDALRDAARFPAIERAFRSAPGFEVSLLRENSTRRALEDARSLFQDRSAGIAMSFEFETSVGGDVFATRLEFGDTGEIPTRVVAIIGYNGSGKTRFLANLGMVAQADAVERAAIASRFGRFVGSDPVFSAVVAVSYSAFDTFEVPNEQHGHVYCGLRRLETERADDESSVRALKSIDDIVTEFLSALETATQRDRRETFEAAVEPLSLEPSFAAVDVMELFELARAETRQRFESLSTGHKIVLNIVTHLVARLQPNALVLIDEPEAHLHPPLLAAMLRSIGIALHRYTSFGVVATHSPVVLQEIPRRNVRLLQRFGQRTMIGEPEIETFGENVGVLTRHVFSLDSSGTDHHAVLQRLASIHSFAEIEALFNGELSSEARAYLVGLRPRA